MVVIFVFKLEFGSCFTSELVQTCSNHRIADCRSETGVPWLILRCSLKFLSLRNTKSIQRNIRNWQFVGMGPVSKKY